MNYANYISKVGEQYFGRKFNAIRDFMPLEEYNKFLLSADVFIYGNWRQEAVGNILIALFIGGKVFLDEKNPLYNPQIQISAESETKRSIFREKDKTKRSKKESAQHSKSRNKSFVMTSVSAL